MKIDHVSDYAARRREEYPPLVDQLDAIWKGGQAAKDMREQVMAVKAKFPKCPKQEGN